MSDGDVRAMAVRLAGYDLADWQGPTGDCADMRCAIVVAKRWLAEHPADEGEAVDVAWADDVGWVQSYGAYWPEGDRSVLLVIGRDTTPVLSYAGRVIAEPATRGAIRRLCAALGIKLKEST